MIRNFVAGVVWGGVVAGVGAGVISQIAPLPTEAVQQAEAVPQLEAPAQPVAEAVAAAKPAEPVVADATAKPASAKTSEPKATEPVADASAEPAKPEAGVEADSTAKVVEAQPDAAPPEPAPAQTVVSEPAVTDAPAALALPAAAGTAPAVVTAKDAAPQTSDVGTLPKIAGAELAPGAADLPPPPAAAEVDSLLKPAPAAVPDPAPAMIAVDPAPAPEKPALLEDKLPNTLPAAQPLKPVVEGVVTGGLVSITPATEAEAATDAPVLAADAPAIQRFARPFANDSDKPLFGVLLRDTGEVDVDRAKLAALPFPVTFVIDPLSDTAAEAAKIYRAAGQEVLMLATGIPDGAKASDLEQTFQAYAIALPEAVAVVDLAQGGFQDNRVLATQVLPLIKAQGRGVITYDKGLNAADQVARREGVASATIFRQLDGEGEEAPVIRRYLDRAAFKAAQEGRVMVLGETRPETIAALMEWTVEGRASSVTLAPATAVMTVQ